MNQKDKICEWCKQWEERLWRIFVLLSTAITLAGALVVAAKHLPIGPQDTAASATGEVIVTSDPPTAARIAEMKNPHPK